MKRLSALVVLVALVGGCSVVTKMTTAERTFTVQVRNESSQPARVGFAKDGTPFEEEWSSPEDLAIHFAKSSEIEWGKLVLPGQTANLGPITGRFSDTSVGICRIYQGDPSTSEMLAMNRRSAGRIDVGLRPGSNRFVLSDDRGQLALKRLPPEPAPLTPANAEKK